MNKKYNCAAVYYKDWGAGGTGLDLAKKFLGWLPGHSDVAADVADAASVASVFDDIHREILYLVGSGTIIDKIAPKFDLVIPDGGVCPFTLTVAGAPVAATADGENKWVYGEKDAATELYPYAVSYDPAQKQFVFTFNVPVEVSHQVQISYVLELNDTSASDAKIPTNVSAVLNYNDSSGKTKDPLEFEIPYVSYMAPEPTETTAAPTEAPTEAPVETMPLPPNTGERGPSALWVVFLAVGGILVITAASFEVIRRRKNRG